MEDANGHPTHPQNDGTLFSLFWPSDLYLLVFLVLWGVLVLITPHPFRYRLDFLFELTLLVLLTLLVPIAHGNRPTRYWLFLRCVYFLFPILYSFRLMHFLIPALRQPGMKYERILIELDRIIFGADLEVYFAPLRSPWLTELMQYFYLTYYVVPLILLLLFVRDFVRNRLGISDVQFFVGSIVLGFLTSYAGYVLVPAIGPRYGIKETLTHDLGELWFAEEIRYWINRLELRTFDAFPSGHTELYFIVMVIAWKYYPRWFVTFLVPFIGMLTSTMYLRYHYGVDLIAGFLLGIGVLYVQARITNRDLCRRTPPGKSTTDE